MRAAVLLSLALFAAPALASTDAVEIRIGTPPPPAPRVDPVKIQAVEGFLAARQIGSRDARRRDEARVYLSKGTAIEDLTLFGPKRYRMVAFDFHDGAIRTKGSNRFEVVVYVLFADGDGHVRESRGETLTFERSGAEYRVASLRASSEVTWAEEGVLGAAASLGLTEELSRAERHLRDWSKTPRRAHAFSVADVYRTDGGGVIVECLRFASDPGKRGYETFDNPLKVTRTNGEIRVESN